MKTFARRGVLMLALLAVVLLERAAPAEGDVAAPFVNDVPGVPIAERWVCDLNAQPGARAADIQGQDGGASIAVGATTYWFFGDTEYNGSPWKNIRNNVAYTNGDTDASDCVDLTHKAAANEAGVNQAQALLGWPVAWPTGPSALQDGFIHFFYIEPREGDALIRVRGLGIARAPFDTLEGERRNGGAFLWDNDQLGELNLSIASATVAVDGASGDPYLYVYFNSTPNGIAGTYTDVFLGRVRASCDQVACPAEDEVNYSYWGGPTGWTDDLAGAVSLWREDGPHNGPSVVYDASLGTWTATYARFPPRGTVAYPSRVLRRVADGPEGPWSPGVPLIDCVRYHDALADGLDCYSAVQHPEVASNGGRTQYASFSTNYGAYPHRVYHEEIHEVQMAAPIWQCTGSLGNEYVVAQSGCASPEGVAFYAIDPATGPPPSGFERVWRWTNGQTNEVMYAPEAPDGAGWTPDATPSFYTPQPDSVDITSYAYDPVYRWNAVAAPQRHVYSALPPGNDYKNGGLAFAAVCPDSDGDGTGDCREAHTSTGLGYPDSDADGCDDASELATSAMAGGRRNPANLWDFFDTPDLQGSRDRRVTISDVTGVVAHFGQTGDPTIDPLSPPPPAPIYHPAFDRRRAAATPDPWDLGPPDGATSIVDIFLVVRQFGHHCAG